MVPPLADRGRLSVNCQFHAENIVVVSEEPAGKITGFDESLGIDDFWVLDASIDQSLHQHIGRE